MPYGADERAWLSDGGATDEAERTKAFGRADVVRGGPELRLCDLVGGAVPVTPLRRCAPQGPSVALAPPIRENAEVLREEAGLPVGVAHDLHRPDRAHDRPLLDGDEHRTDFARSHAAAEECESR